MKYLRLSVAALAGLALIVGACKTNSPSQPKDDTGGGSNTGVTLEVDPTSVDNGVVGTPVQLTATLKKSGTPVVGQTLKFATSIGILAASDGTTNGTGLYLKPTDSAGKVNVLLMSTTVGTGVLTVLSSSPYAATTEVRLKFGTGGFAVTSVNPATGNPGGGDTVHVLGSGFSATPVKVMFGTTEAVVTSATDSDLTLTSPAAPSGAAFPLAVDVSVTIRYGQATALTITLPAAYTYTAVTPDILGVSPSSGGPIGGETVTVTGSNFSNDARVSFGARVATEVIERTSGRIVVKVPAPATGSSYPLIVDVSVTNSPGKGWERTSILTNGYTYTLNTPIVDRVDPNHGVRDGGNAVDIIGSGFLSSPQPRVTFAGLSATVVSVTPTRITVTVPKPATGSTFPMTVDVTVTNNFGTTYASQASLAAAYTYDRGPVPTIQSVSPRSGGIGGGNQVTITGENFCSNAQVKFGSALANVVSVSATRIVVVAPPAPAGTDPSAGLSVDICITCPNAPEPGPFCTASAYTYGCEALPAISSISPSSGPIEGGTTVVIFGSGFTPGMQAYLNGQEINTRYVSSSQLGATIPPINVIATQGQPCPIEIPLDLVVRNAYCGAEATLTQAFTYRMTWAISSNSPVRGYYTGGEKVTIYGQGFTYPLTVDIDGFLAQVVSVSDTEIVVNTGASKGCPGLTPAITVCSVQFANCLCAKGGSFQYEGPFIASISPLTLHYPSSWAAGNPPVTVYGQGFVSPMTVTVGGTSLLVPAPTGGYPVTTSGLQYFTFQMPIPGISSLNTVDCPIPNTTCLGKQYALTALDFTLTPPNGLGCASTSSIMIDPDDKTCRVTPPTASFTTTPGAAGSFQVTFNDTSTSNAGGVITGWTWNFGDGSPASNLQSPTHTYAAAGSYTVSLTVTDSCTGVGSTSQSVTAP